MVPRPEWAWKAFPLHGVLAQAQPKPAVILSSRQFSNVVPTCDGKDATNGKLDCKRVTPVIGEGISRHSARLRALLARSILPLDVADPVKLYNQGGDYAHSQMDAVDSFTSTPRFKLSRIQSECALSRRGSTASVPPANGIAGRLG